MKHIIRYVAGKPAGESEWLVLWIVTNTQADMKQAWDKQRYPTQAAAQSVCDELNQKVADRLAWFHQVKRWQKIKVTDRFGRSFDFIVSHQDEVSPIFNGIHYERLRVDMVDFYVKMEIIEEAVK